MKKYIPVKNTVQVHNEDGSWEVVKKEDFTNEHAKKVLNHAKKEGLDVNAYAQKVFLIVDESNQLDLLADATPEGEQAEPKKRTRKKATPEGEQAEEKEESAQAE